MMTMERNKITKTIYLFGERIDVKFEADDYYDDHNAPQLPPPPPPPPPPPTVRTRGGIELPFGASYVCSKKLGKFDVSLVQSRLLIPNCQEIYDFLNAQEKKLVLNEKKGIEVKAIDYQYRQHKLNFKKWPSVGKFVLNRGWNELVGMNHLYEGDAIDLWCYRQGEANDLHFAVDIYLRAWRPSTLLC